MHAVLLAGGEGRRLFPHTEQIPKALVPIRETPVIALVLRLLARQGVTSVDLAVNHRADQIRAVIGDGRNFGVPVRYCHEPTSLSTIGPLTLIDDLPAVFLVMNADVLTDLPPKTLLDAHHRNGAFCTVACTRRHEQTDFGVLTVGADNQVTAFTEKPTASYLVSMGMYLMSREILSDIPRGQRYGFDQLMMDLLKRNQPIHAIEWDGYWLDIGRPADYERAQLDADRYDRWLTSPGTLRSA